MVLCIPSTKRFAAKLLCGTVTIVSSYLRIYNRQIYEIIMQPENVYLNGKYR